MYAVKKFRIASVCYENDCLSCRCSFFWIAVGFVGKSLCSCTQMIEEIPKILVMNEAMNILISERTCMLSR